MDQSQKLLLTWLIEVPGLYGQIKKYISPEDFTEGLYRRVAGQLFAQYGEEGAANPAKIVSNFLDEGEQREIAELFNARIREVATKDDREKAVRETAVRVKQNSIKQRSEGLSPSDMPGLMKLVEDRRALEELERLHISID